VNSRLSIYEQDRRFLMKRLWHNLDNIASFTWEVEDKRKNLPKCFGQDFYQALEKYKCRALLLSLPAG
jgi:hypothetical protein